ncbi:MAG: MFS transporter [Candidatus Natronoplasma sp.]
MKFFEPFLYLFFLANGLSFTQIGFLISIREVSTIVMELPTGVVADLTGRRRAMSTAFFSYMVSFFIFYYFSSFLLFAPAMFLFAIGETLRHGTHKSMIMQYLDNEGMEDQRVEYYGKTRGASRLGSALSALIAGAIVYSVGGYNVIFLATLIPYSIAFVLMLTYPKELDGEPEGASIASTWNHLKNSFHQLYKHAGLGKMLVNASIYDSFFKISKDYLSPIVESLAITLPMLMFIETEEQRTAILVGVVYFFVYINSFASSIKSSSFMSKIGNIGAALNVLYFVMASLFLLVAIFLQLDLLIFSIIAFFFFFTLYNLRKPMVIGYVGDRMDSQTRATLFSGQNLLRSVVGMIIAPILGYLADNFSISIAFLFGAITLFIFGIIIPIKNNK